LTTAALVAAGRAAPTPALENLLTYALIGVAFGAMAWWVRANRVALDQAEWCACASHAVGVRVIRSNEAGSPIHRPRRHRNEPVRSPHDREVTTRERSATLQA
jgi:hypothetical protein